MKMTRYAMALAAAVGLFSACTQMDQPKAYDPDKIVAPELHALPAEIVITADNMGTMQAFTWDAADFGVQTQINYSLEVSYDGGAKVAIQTGMSDTSTSLSYENLNQYLFGSVGVPADTPSEVQFYVSATIGTNFEVFYSQPVTVMVTVTAAERTYPEIYVIGDYSAWTWDNAQSQRLFSFSADQVNYEGVVDFSDKAANGFKLTGAKDWNNGNWGVDGAAAAPAPEAASITLIDDGGSGNISVYAHRFYRFAFNRTSLTLTKELSFDQLGVIGDFNGWAGDVVMNFDAATQRFWADVDITADGGLKFRQDGAWDISYGSATAGKLDSGDNIPVTVGKYRIYVNLNNSADQTYELNTDDYDKGGDTPPPVRADWYLYGQTAATPDWGETAMTKKGDIYGVAGIDVATASEFLFRSGDQSQYIGVDATFAAGANPYPVMIGTAFTISGAADKVNARIADAGTYDYWFLPGANLAYVAAAGTVPGIVSDTWGLVGTLNNWGDVGDLTMTDNGTYFVRTGITLTASTEFKIRFNNAWDDTKNYGTASGGAIDINSAVPVITSGGSQNMKVQLDGTYDIYFDLTNSLIYVMTAGTTPSAL